MMIKTISDTIIWIAKDRLRRKKYQNLSSAIHSVTMDIMLDLCSRIIKDYSFYRDDND